MPRNAPSAAPALRVVDGGGRTHPKPFVEGFRLRPGERPAWIDLELAEDDLLAWRRRAAVPRLSVDVWLALQLEWMLVVADVGPDVAEHVVQAAAEANELPALAPTDELRSWVTWLCSGSAKQIDDLPSVVLPQRILARLRPSFVEREIHAVAGAPSHHQALTVELAAAVAGMTLEAWAYRTATRLAAH